MAPDPNAFPNCHLDPQITDAHLDASVKHIIAVAALRLLMKFSAPRSTTGAFFLLFLLTRRLYMVKMSGTDVRGVMGILLKPYAVSNRSVKPVELPLGHQICTVRKAWGLLNSKGFLRYKYTAAGEGCRAWLANAANTFENDGGFVVQGTVLNTLWPIITQVWSDANTSTVRDMQSGNFY